MAKERIFHDAILPDVERVFSIDFTGEVSDGETIATATVVGYDHAGAASSDMLVGNPLIEATNALIVTQLFEGDADEQGHTHRFLFTATTTLDNVYKAWLHLTVTPTETIEGVARDHDVDADDNPLPVMFTFSELNMYAQRDFSAAEYNLAEEVARKFMEEYCQRSFISATHTDEEVDPGKSKMLTCKHWPVASVAEVTGHYIAQATVDTIETDAYRVREWGVLLTARGDYDYFVVTYTSGSAEIPLPVRRAALAIGKMYLLPKDKPTGASSISSGGANYNFIQADFDGQPTGEASVDTVLNMYRFSKIRAI